MGYSCYPESGLRWWHVVVFLGFVVLVVDIATINTMGSKSNQFVVGPGVQLRGAVPAPAPPLAPAPRELVEVPVAAKDLPVGTVFAADAALWTTKKVPRDALPPGVVMNTADLIGRRLSRALRAEETFDRNSLTKGLALPEGYEVVTLPVGARNTPGFIVPGSRVDLMASLRRDNTLKVFDLLVNVLVVSVECDSINDKNGVYPDVTRMGFALTKQQAAALELARVRGCGLMPLLRHPNRTAEVDAEYSIDQVIELLKDQPRTGVAPPPRPVNEDR